MKFDKNGKVIEPLKKGDRLTVDGSQTKPLSDSLEKLLRKLVDEDKKEEHSIITDEEMKRLAVIGQNITDGLSCDINGQGVPCRTDRFASVYFMIEYLQIHNFIFFQEELIDFYKPRTHKETYTKYIEDEKDDNDKI